MPHEVVKSRAGGGYIYYIWGVTARIFFWIWGQKSKETHNEHFSSGAVPFAPQHIFMALGYFPMIKVLIAHLCKAKNEGCNKSKSPLLWFCRGWGCSSDPEVGG